LTQLGVTYLIVLEGINDIGQPGAGRPNAETESARDHRGIATDDRACTRAWIKVYGATLTPFAGTKGNY
jgi:hypothetical protein